MLSIFWVDMLAWASFKTISTKNGYNVEPWAWIAAGAKPTLLGPGQSEARHTTLVDSYGLRLQ
jgi:hypothetical protein